MVITQKNGSHQELSLDKIRVLLGVVLSHDSTEGVTSDEDLGSREASLLEFVEGILDISIDEDWLWGVEEEFWKTNPDLLVVLGSLRLDLGGKGFVSLWVTLHTVDPNNGDLFSGNTGGWWHDGDVLSKGLRGSSDNESDEVSEHI